jgi:hypothetical protein
LRPKIGRLLFGQLVWRKIFLFLFFILDEWTTYFTSFPWTPSTPNSNSIWARGNFLLKTSIKLIFHVFSKEFLHAAMWLKLPQGPSRVLKKKFVLPIKSWFFSFFSFFFFAHGFAWCHLQCDENNMNVKFLIFPRIFTRSTVLKFGIKTPVNKTNSSSLILTNLELEFEVCMLNLI